jgi:alkanesulfonate monooxygenase SsuD/methylene tetrahydromethanopterin reductase-like flavin-dependent oxidoreductase (luciferase family)
MRGIGFGFGVPIFANPGMAFFRTPCFERLEWEPVCRAVLECEKLGFDSIFVGDHLFLGRDGAIYECWTTLTALAGMTRNIRLGTIHLGDSLRHPPLVAKMACTLDVISGGRLEFFYDFGWREAEYTAYGVPFLNNRERVEKMTEGLGLILRLMTEERVTFKGKYYQVKDALCAPKPIQRPHPPVWLGENNEEGMMEAIIEYADVWNSTPAPAEAYKEKLSALQSACEKAGRDYTTMEKTLETQILICRDEREIDRTFERIDSLKPPGSSSDEDILKLFRESNPALELRPNGEEFRREFIIGTPERVEARLLEYIRLGVTRFMLWFMDFPSLDGIRLFASTVMPKFR